VAGLDPDEVGRAGPGRVLHAHNLNPAFGLRALAAAREAGARVVHHLHQYRLVCAVGVCFTRGETCTRCDGRNSPPRLAARVSGAAEVVVYAAGLAVWQRRLAAQVDAFVVSNRFALERLRPAGRRSGRRMSPATSATSSASSPTGRRRAEGYALFVGRLAPEKGRRRGDHRGQGAGVELVAGDGPLREDLARRSEAGRSAGRGSASSAG
jgi:glycosyltransferase involved in cell wall biosynthesis